ncbi:MAG: FecR domain-containing protein, partial [Bacteroidales bacterium]|nr:FecR domain-containing protein [Bacteroidales bacterium]
MITFPGNTDDFLMDDEFNDFVLNNTEKKDKTWKKYFEQHPELKPEAEKARKIISGLHSLKDTVSEKEIKETQLHSNFEDTWKKYHDSKSKKVILHASALVWRIAAAAAIIIFSVTFYAILNNMVFHPHKNVVYSEIYVPAAKQSRLTLPDGSVAWVNSETKIKYSNQFNQEERNIYLDGEAYFEVSPNIKLPLKVFSKGVE